MAKKVNLNGGQSVKEQLPRKSDGCDCEVTYVVEKLNEFAGKALRIRLCCMAKEVEKLTGKDFMSVFSK